MQGSTWAPTSTPAERLAQAGYALVAKYFSAQGYTRSLALIAVENSLGSGLATKLGYRRIAQYGTLGRKRLSLDWSRPVDGLPVPRLVRAR